MKTVDDVIFANSRKMKELTDPSTDLMITFPPYPMIGAHALSAVKELSGLSSARPFFISKQRI
jgi:DNA modification methylase